MIRTSSSSDQADRNSVLRIQPSRLCASRQRFDVAVMKETLLLMELETQEFCVDLRALSKLVLSDLGATLQVLRLAGREYGDAEGRPVRVEDCIADLGIQACMEAMSAHLMPRDVRSPAVSRVMASFQGDCGAFSSILPNRRSMLIPIRHILSASVIRLDHCQVFWAWMSRRTRSLTVCEWDLSLAREWSLPGCVVDYFSDLEKCGGRSAWLGIVQAAHRCAGEPTGECASHG